jgi:hypothetical protein
MLADISAKDEYDEYFLVAKNWYEFVDKFRDGHYDAASNETKLSWYVFCDNILPTVAKKAWKSNLVRANSLLSDTVSISDEAYAILVCKSNLPQWISKLFSSKNNKDRFKKVRREDNDGIDESGNKDDEDDEDQQPEIDDSMDSMDDIDLYYKLFERIRESRGTAEGKSWDLAFKERCGVTLERSRRLAAEDEEQGNKRKAGRSSSGNGENRRTIVVEKWFEA